MNVEPTSSKDDLVDLMLPQDLTECAEGEGEEDWLGLGVLRTTWDCQGGPKVAIVEGPFGVEQVVQVAVEGGGHSWPPARVHPEQEMWAWAQQWTT